MLMDRLKVFHLNFLVDLTIKFIGNSIAPRIAMHHYLKTECGYVEICWLPGFQMEITVIKLGIFIGEIFIWEK